MQLTTQIYWGGKWAPEDNYTKKRGSTSWAELYEATQGQDKSEAGPDKENKGQMLVVSIATGLLFLIKIRFFSALYTTQGWFFPDQN